MKRQTRRWIPEQLEVRTLPSVSTLFNPGTGVLTLKGNSGSDQVSLEGNGVAGGVEVYVNGLFVNTFAGVQDITVNMKGGNDVLNLSSFTIPGNVTIKMGSGADILDVDTVTDFGAGPDVLLSVGGTFQAKMGSNPGDLIQMDGGASVVISGDAKLIGAADVDLDGDGGTSGVEVGDLNFGGDLKIDFSPWGDVDGDSKNLDIDDINVFGATTIVCSVADDVIEIGDSSFAGPTTVLLSFGTNLFDVDVGGDANNFGGLLTLSGAFGIDTYDASAGNTLGGGLNPIGIEFVI